MKMLSKIGVLARSSGSRIALLQKAVRNYHHEHGDSPVKVASFNELPIPSGSWEKAYKAKQMRYNIYLLGSVIFFGATSAYVYTSGLFEHLRNPIRHKLD